MAGFKIIKDFLYEQDILESGTSILDSMVGKEVQYKGGELHARVYDDDDICYYEALCDGDDGAELFNDWSENDSGSVYSKIQNPETEAWEGFIG